MGTGNVAAIVAGIAAIIGAILTYRAGSQANRISATKVDSEAYDRAQVIWEKALTHSDREIDQLRKYVERLEEQLFRERESSDELRRVVARLKDTVARMERHNAHLRQLLRAAGIAIPEPGDDDAQTA
jgi:predicted RNase H-like nuclease (RuvC/YqgF family)